MFFPNFNLLAVGTTLSQSMLSYLMTSDRNCERKLDNYKGNVYLYETLSAQNIHQIQRTVHISYNRSADLINSDARARRKYPRFLRQSNLFFSVLHNLLITYCSST